MAYAEVTDIEAEFKNIDFQRNTLVTTANVESFITQSDALINSFVSMKYAMPITKDEPLALLKLYSITLVADRIKKILEVRQATNTNANQEVRGAFGTKDVMASLKAIKDGDLVLLGETLVAGSGQGVFFSNTASLQVEPIFQKEVDTW